MIAPVTNGTPEPAKKSAEEEPYKTVGGPPPTGEPAERVGSKFPRPEEDKKAPEKPKESEDEQPTNPQDMTPREIAQLFDGAEKWSDKPTMVGQGQMDPAIGAWKVDRFETAIFDLQKSEDVQKYNDLMSNFHKPDSNIQIMQHEIKAFEAISGWKAMVVFQRIKFRKLLIKK